MSSERAWKAKQRLLQKQRAHSLQYAGDELRHNRTVVITAMLNHPGALMHCLDEDLIKELKGKSRGQLQKLLDIEEEKEDPFAPRSEQEAKPPPPELLPEEFGLMPDSGDDTPLCLMCFDCRGVCATCKANVKKPGASMSSSKGPPEQ